MSRDSSSCIALPSADCNPSTSGQTTSVLRLGAAPTSRSSSRNNFVVVGQWLSDSEQRWHGFWSHFGAVCKKRIRLSDTAIRLASGVSSAVVARTCVAPLERVKLESQIALSVGSSSRSRARLPLNRSLRRIIKREGFLGLWKGNKVNLMRTAPYKAMNFLVFDTLHDLLLKRGEKLELSNRERAFSGAAAGVLSAMCFFPLDVVRTRLIANDKYKAMGVARALTHIVRKEGFGGLYRGALPALISMGPNGAVFYGMYDWLKMQKLRSRCTEKGVTLESLSEEEKVLGKWQLLLHGAISGAASETSTYPLDLVRRRMQVQTGSFGRMASPSRMVHMLRDVVQKHTVFGLYAGLLPSVLQVLPSSALGYLTYESTKAWLEHNFRDPHH